MISLFARKHFSDCLAAQPQPPTEADDASPLLSVFNECLAHTVEVNLGHSVDLTKLIGMNNILPKLGSNSSWKEYVEAFISLFTEVSRYTRRRKMLFLHDYDGDV